MKSRVLSMLSQIEHLPAKPKANQILASQTEAAHTKKQTQGSHWLLIPCLSPSGTLQMGS